MDRCLSWFDCVSITSASSVIHSPHTSVLHRKNNVSQRAETKCCSAGAPVPTSIGFLKASTWCQMLQKTKHRALQKQGPVGSQKAWSKMKLFYVPSIIIIYVPWSNVGKSWIPSCHDIWVLDPRCPAGETLFSSTSADPFLPSKKVLNSWLAVKCQRLSSSRLQQGEPSWEGCDWIIQLDPIWHVAGNSCSSVAKKAAWPSHASDFAQQESAYCGVLPAINCFEVARGRFSQAKIYVNQTHNTFLQ